MKKWSADLKNRRLKRKENEEEHIKKKFRYQEVKRIEEIKLKFKTKMKERKLMKNEIKKLYIGYVANIGDNKVSRFILRHCISGASMKQEVIQAI